MGGYCNGGGRDKKVGLWSEMQWVGNEIILNL